MPHLSEAMAKPVMLDFFGHTAAFHHVGLAIQHAANAGITDLAMTTDPVQRVRVGFVTVGDCCIELIEPLGEDSPVSNSIKQGYKLLHICFEVDNLEESLQEAEGHSFKILQYPVPAAAFANRRIAWLWHPNWGVFELLERHLAAP